jgi:hypothetical protein
MSESGQVGKSVGARLKKQRPVHFLGDQTLQQQKPIGYLLFFYKDYCVSLCLILYTLAQYSFGCEMCHLTVP